MTHSTETIILNGSKEAIEAINNKIKEQPECQTHITERRNLDGDTATWIVIATLTSQSLTPILNFVKDYITKKSVTKIKIGDFEVENPTTSMIKEFETSLHNHLIKSQTNG